MAHATYTCTITVFINICFIYFPQTFIAVLPAEDKAKAANVRAIILDDGFWTRLERVVALLQPIVRVLRLADTCMAGSVCLIHKAVNDVTHFLNTDDSLAWLRPMQSQAVRNVWRQTTEKFNSPLFAAAYYLTPAYMYTGEPVVMTDALQTIMHDAIQDYYGQTNDDARISAEAEWISFVLRHFGDNARKAVAMGMPPHVFWETIQLTAPNLWKLATRLTALPASATACERYWAACDFVVSKRRNPLSADHADKSVRLQTHLRRIANGDTHDKLLCRLLKNNNVINPNVLDDEQVEAGLEDDDFEDEVENEQEAPAGGDANAPNVNYDNEQAADAADDDVVVSLADPPVPPVDLDALLEQANAAVLANN